VAEAESARAAAERAGASFDALRVDLAAGADLQARAREARYRALELAAPAEAVIATGHTQTDQAETVLQRVLRGAGRRGLQGIRPRRGRIVRPMLTITRGQTRSLGLPFVDDPSNATPAYQRNRVRDTLLSHLKREEPNVEATLALIASQSAGEEELLAACLSRHPMSLDEVVPLGLAATEAWLRWQWPPGASASRAVIRGLARAALGRHDYGPQRLDSERIVSLRGGHLVYEDAADPRLRVVAPGPGAYRLLNHRLVIKRGTIEQQTHAPIHSTRLDASTLLWPITAHRRGPSTTPYSEPEFHLTDGTGRLLWESTNVKDDAQTGRDLHIALFVW
jgi:tRNA(Ile)-lysidine synthase